MTTIYLIRHAEAEGNIYRRIHGWYDSLITDNGFRQIEALAERFRDIPVDAVYASDLYRTMTTARAIYVPKHLPLHTDPELREINLGDWEDQPWGLIRHIDPENMDRFNRSDPTWRAPNGESLWETGDRVFAALERIAQAHPGQTVAVFCHGTAIRQILSRIRGLSPDLWHTAPHSDNTAVSRLTYAQGTFEIDFAFDASHLTPELSTLAKQNWWRKDSTAAPDVQLWFRPLDWEKEQSVYLAARHEAWVSTHGPHIAFEAEPFLRDAVAHLARSPWGVSAAMKGDEVVGLIQLDTQRYCEDNAGYIPFCYIDPQHRDHKLGVQLIGHAVSFFRPLGRDKLRLRCAPYNDRAQHFYKKFGFSKIGEESGARVPLDIMEKYIGYDR